MSTSTDRLRIGLIGCGTLGTSVHLANLRSMSGLEVSAVADPDPARLQRAGRSAHRARSYASGETLLKNEPLDAVVVASPPVTHAALAETALRKGISVYLEKPLALSQEEGQKLAEAARVAKASLMMGFNFRFSPVFRELRDMLRREAAGRVLLARSVFTTLPPRTPTGAGKWRGEPGGDVLWELGSHHLDLIPFLFDSPVVKIRASGGRASHARDQSRSCLSQVEVFLQLETGVRVQTFLAFDAGLENRVEIFGSQGSLEADRFRDLRVRTISPRRRIWDYFGSVPAAAASVLRWREWSSRLRAPWGDPSYARALEYFADSLRRGRQPCPGLAEGLRSLQLLEKARESLAATKRLPDQE